MRGGRAALVAMLLLAGHTARADDCARDAADLREHLLDARHSAHTWNTVWRVGYTASAVGSLALALADPIPSLTDGFYVIGGKAVIAATSRWVMPIRVHVPDALDDPCADRAALRLELARVAKQERTMFYMTHVGSILLNGIGSAILWRYDGFGKAALSFGTGYTVGLISNYTMPRASWHRYRERDWTVDTVSLIPLHEGGMLDLSGSF